MPKTILLTGGAGYVGSVLTEKLLDCGCNVIVVDDLSTGNREAVEKQAQFIRGDFADEGILKWIFDYYSIDFVIHLAASANVTESVKSPIIYYQNNTAKTLVLLGQMLEYGVKNIIFTSSASVFGEPCYYPVDENHPLLPMSPYGNSKLMTEIMLRDFGSAYGINYIIFRYLNVAGATEKHGESRKNETHLIPRIIQKILNDKEKLIVYGDLFPTRDGSCVRDYFHVSDVANAHILAMGNIGTVKNQIFNLGYGDGHSVFEIIRQTERVINCKVNYQVAPARAGEPAILVADISKVKKLLGWLPQKNIVDILKSAYNWQKNKLY